MPNVFAIRGFPLLLLLTGSMPLNGQEVRFVDLTVVQQRTELRHPPAPPPICDQHGTCTSGGVGGGSVGDGAPDRRDPKALGIYLLRVSPTDIDPHEPFEVEFKILNTGTVAIDLPVAPHRSDLQPEDASLSFTYFSLALVAMISPEPYVEAGSFGFVELYGSPDHGESMVRLKPGEWIRVKANIKLRTWPENPGAARMSGGMWLHKNTFRPNAGGYFTAAENVYPNITPTPWQSVYLIRPPDAR